MGVAQYQLTQSLPEQLKSEHPTNEDLADELPLLDLVTLRIQLEKKLAQLAKAHHLDWERESIGMLVTNLHLHEIVSTELLHTIMVLSLALNRVLHGQRISPEDAQRTLEEGKAVLAQLSV